VVEEECGEREGEDDARGAEGEEDLRPLRSMRATAMRLMTQLRSLTAKSPWVAWLADMPACLRMRAR